MLPDFRYHVDGTVGAGLAHKVNCLAPQRRNNQVNNTALTIQHTGWNTIIYLSALSTVDAETLEAARIDGANRLQKILYIDVPAILPTIVILLIMRSGTVLNIGFEKVYLLQNDLNRDVSEVISTYTYRLGILEGQFSYTTAIGLFNNAINAAILILVNQISRSVGETSLW